MQLPAVVLSTVWTWLAVSRLSQHYALHMKQDMGLYPLGEFTSSGPPPPPQLPHLPSWNKRPLQLEARYPEQQQWGLLRGGGGGGGGGGGSKRGSFSSCTLENGSQSLEPNIKTPRMTKVWPFSGLNSSVLQRFSFYYNEPQKTAYRNVLGVSTGT